MDGLFSASDMMWKLRPELKVARPAWSNKQAEKVYEEVNLLKHASSGLHDSRSVQFSDACDLSRNCCG